jgi:cystathionine beta-lyase
MKFETKTIHGLKYIDEKYNDWNNTISMASAYKTEEFGKEQDFEYGRVSNPTRRKLEKLMAVLENGKHGYAFSSGMAAITSVFTKFKAGDHIILGTDIYGGTYRIITDIFAKFNLKYTFVDTTDLNKIRDAIKPETVAIFIETPSNPLLDITDIRGVVKIAKEHGLLTIVDNTFLTPYLQKPLELGADIVVHSATKFLSGHHDIIAGIVIVNDDKLAEEVWFAQKAIGAILPPFDSWLLIRSLKTLKIRVDTAQNNTLKLLEFFRNHPSIEKVYSPIEDDNIGKEIHKNQASGIGAVFSFILKDKNKVKTFFENLKIATLAPSLGGAETLVTHPSTVTHAEMPEEEKNARGITNTMIRVAVGLENIDDLIEDFKSALEK